MIFRKQIQSLSKYLPRNDLLMDLVPGAGEFGPPPPLQSASPEKEPPRTRRFNLGEFILRRKKVK